MTWQASSFAVLAAILLVGFLWYERRRPPARVVALVAVLAALAVVGRLAFAAIPNVKPTTDIVLFAGYALGPIPGFVVGGITALASNVFFGQGPWTAWQMVAWGACGVAGGGLAWLSRGREIGRIELAIACGLAGLAFGAFMDVYQWTLAAEQDLASYLAIAATSLPYNLAHALGNVVFCLLIGPLFIRSLERCRRRFEFTWTKPGAGQRAAGAAAALLVALAVVAAGGRSDRVAEARAMPAEGGPSATAAASRAGRASRYLAAAQNRDGGFGGAAGSSSSQLYTGWAALGLAAASRNPHDVRRKRGRSIVEYLRRSSRALTDLGDVERTILVLVAAGAKPRAFAGRNLVAEVRRHRRPDGSIGGYVSYTAFGILALDAARTAVWPSAIGYLEGAQNPDGGFGIAPDVPSDADMTGAALQALAVVGEGGGEVARRAIAYLEKSQNSDGGFGIGAGRASNAQSTSYAIQGLVAVRAAPRVVTRALALLARLQRRDGSVRYSATSTQTPVWVTAQALAALRRKPLPLTAVPRRRRTQARPATAQAVEQVAPASAEDSGGRSRSRSEERGSGGGRAGAGEPGEPAVRRGADGGGEPGTVEVRAAKAEGSAAEAEDGGLPTTAIVLGAAALLILAGMVPWRPRSMR